MSDDDLIRRGDAQKAVQYHVTDDDDRNTLSHAIAALPARGVGVPTEDIDALAYRFWSIHPNDIPEAVGMPKGYKGGKRAWFYATEIRRILAALEPAPADTPEEIGILRGRVESLLADNAALRRELAMGRAATAPTDAAQAREAALKEAAEVLEEEIRQAKQYFPPSVPILRGVSDRILALIGEAHDG